MWIAIIWIFIFVSFEVTLSVGYSILISKADGCCPSKDVLDRVLKLNYDFTVVGTVLYILWAVQGVPGSWFLGIMVAYACWLRGNTDRVRPQHEEPDEAAAEAGMMAAGSQDELAIDPMVSHESRLLGHSPAAVHQPRDEHPAAAPRSSKRRFQAW